jgi:hypothetical protein
MNNFPLRPPPRKGGRSKRSTSKSFFQIAPTIDDYSSKPPPHWTTSPYTIETTNAHKHCDLTFPTAKACHARKDAREKPTPRSNIWANTSIKTSKPTQPRTMCTLKGMPTLDFTTRRTAPHIARWKKARKREGRWFTTKTLPRPS